MTKCFVDDQIDQRLMMPPSLHDWLPEDHLARFAADLAPSLDLTAFYASYEEKDGRGQAAYHPVIAVDAEAQVIVAADITQEVNDKQQLAPMLEQVQQNTGAKPVAVSIKPSLAPSPDSADPRRCVIPDRLLEWILSNA